MITGKPYFDYKFLGVESFPNALKQAGVSFLPYDEPCIHTIRTGNASFFTNDDTITCGMCSKDKKDIFFIDDTHWSWKASEKIFGTMRFD